MRDLRFPQRSSPRSRVGKSQRVITKFAIC